MTTAFCSKKLSDLTGARFNRLTVVSYAGKKGSNGYGITADKIPTRARAMLESTNRRAGAGQGKPLWQLKEMRVTTDDCECGHGTKNSHRLDDFGGLKCDHCDSSQCIDGFEDADGLPVTQYVDANGYLTRWLDFEHHVHRFRNEALTNRRPVKARPFYHYLQDEPTADCNHDPIANAVGKVFAVTALLCLIAFYLGVATGR